MATAVTIITNVSIQAVPILYGTIASALSNSDVPANKNGQLLIKPNSSVTIETARLDDAQLEQLRRLNMITYTG